MQSGLVRGDGQRVSSRGQSQGRFHSDPKPGQSHGQGLLDELRGDGRCLRGRMETFAAREPRRAEQ